MEQRKRKTSGKGKWPEGKVFLLVWEMQTGQAKPSLSGLILYAFIFSVSFLHFLIDKKMIKFRGNMQLCCSCTSWTPTASRGKVEQTRRISR